MLQTKKDPELMMHGALVALIEAGKSTRSPESVIHANQNSGRGRFGVESTASRTGNGGEYGPVMRTEVHVITL